METMEDVDYRYYLCSNCCRRVFWDELSPEEHRCICCRHPNVSCARCKKRFEPRRETDMHCKRCDYHIVNQATTTPPDLPDPAELELGLDLVEDDPDLVEPERECSMARRWKNIKSDTGIEDGYFMD